MRTAAKICLQLNLQPAGTVHDLLLVTDHDNIRDSLLQNMGRRDQSPFVVRQILKTAPGVKLVSGFFIMDVPNCAYGDGGTFLFADCGLNQDPTAEERRVKLQFAVKLKLRILLFCDSRCFYHLVYQCMLCTFSICIMAL